MKHFFSLLIALSSLFAYSQNLPTYAPVSPNAASIGKFGSFPVNHNLGTTNISIPLYTVKQGDIELPISLSYNATSGIRVNEEASWVGLGWTLNAGGAIVRNVKGQPSTENIPDISSTLDFNGENYTYLLGAHYGFKDTASDEYLFNYSGVSGKFLYDQNKSDFVFINYKPIKIDFLGYPSAPTGYSGYSFKAILDSGQQLEFGASEVIDRWGSGTLANDYKKYITASYLTKIISKNQTDNITFEYDTQQLEKGKEISGAYSQIAYGGTTTGAGAHYGESPILSSPYTYYEKILKRINFKNGYVIFDYSLDRIDSDSGKLNHIKVYSLINGISKLEKQITFNYGYYNRFGGKTYSGNIPSYNPNKYYKSLKLNSVDVYSNSSNPQTYGFEYDSTQLSIRNSSGQDFWGYSNNNSEGFIHMRTTNLYTTNSIGGSISVTVGYGNRSADEEKTKACILTKIIYPTGGYTEFEYEANKSIETETINTYTSYGHSILSEGTGGFGVCDTGLKTKTFSPETQPFEAKLNIVFSDAFNGNGNQSYGEFNGQKYYRDPSSTLYPATSHYIDLSLDYNETYTIKAMEYGDGAPGASGCPLVSVNVSWKELSGTTTQVVENLTGGLRIKSITNFNGADTNFTSKKEFSYSGLKQLIPINLEDYQTLNTSQFNNVINSHPTYALNINGGPSTEYLNIDEFSYDNLGNDNGKISYTYEETKSDRIIGTSSGSGSMFNIFVHPDHYPCIINDEAQIHSEPNHISLLRNHSYGNFSNYLTKTWTSGNLKKREVFKRNSNNTYTRLKVEENNYNEVDEMSLNVNYIKVIYPINNPYPPIVDLLSTTLASCGIQAFANNSIIYNTGYYSFGKKLLTSTVNRQYDSNGENPIEIVKNFSYNNDYLLSETTTTNSQGQTIRAKNYYPDDVTSNISLGNDDLTTSEMTAISLMQSPSDINPYGQHRISTPIQTETRVESSGVLLSKSTQRTSYKNWGNNLVLPETIKTLKGEHGATNTLEDRVKFHGYYANGNVKELSKADGTHIVYIWGYNQTQPIAKIENATHAEVQGHVSNLQTLSDADNDRTVGNVGSEGALRAALENLRSGLPNAQVSTYTYDPLIGVTSMTDPRGQTMYYEYDAFNRLEHVKDKDGNILSKNQYNYATQN